MFLVVLVFGLSSIYPTFSSFVLAFPVRVFIVLVSACASRFPLGVCNLPVLPLDVRFPTHVFDVLCVLGYRVA